MPLTYSITNGFAAGFVVYTTLKLLKGEFKDINLGLIVITLISLLVFILH
jgi:AGZA family xanthine/uracil permease-like MFS transporter